MHDVYILLTLTVWGSTLGLKKIYCLFPISDRPYQTCATQIYFMDFQKKKKLFFLFLENYKLRDELPTVIKVTRKTLHKGEGGGGVKLP